MFINSLRQHYLDQILHPRMRLHGYVLSTLQTGRHPCKHMACRSYSTTKLLI